MDSWADIRLKARECHTAALKRAKGVRASRALIDAALDEDDLELRHYNAGELVGEGVLGFLDRVGLLVNVLRGQDPADEAAVIAHEIGHFKLHLDPSSEVTVVSSGLGGDPIDSGAGRVEGYSSRERKEIQADIFAGEFLCPADWLREELVDRGRKPSEIAAELGLPASMVLHQAIRALLLPPLRAPAEIAAGPTVELDDSQREAAEWKEGPLLVDAGPGTGKTRTLVHRIGRLLSEEALPGSILALTFSNKAAEEMRERLSAGHRDAAIEMWVGTFHQFGLEMVTKWPGRLRRTEKVRVFDETASLALLEKNLERLPLRHYQNLYEPAYELVHVLRAISRCKDELITWEEYLAAAQAALAEAPEEERENADKAVEIGEIYRVYEEALVDEDAVDFGDLVRLPIQLLGDQDIKDEYQRRFQHILVDEFQDVNLASARLLQALAGSCEDVWVVADQRQSIYRFRGAKPSNVAEFERSFGGERRSLGHNYRSGEAVVEAFGQFSRNMAAAPATGNSWSPARGEVGQVSMTVASTVAGEAAAIRDKIEELHSQGVAYRDQCILARSHLTLARITEPLERLGVPLLYLGDLFERVEIRDLLSLVAVDAEFGGIGLVRVAQLPEYRATKEDALALIQWAQENDLPVLDALRRIGEIEGLTPEGRAGLAQLSAQLEGMGPATSPWTLLTTWLFERSNYLAPLMRRDDPEAMQQRVAIYQLLKVCGEHLALGDASRKRFLERVRRIEALNQDTMYRAIASEASDFDAVRVMTIHGSKGLEFRAVHLPGLATRYMPASRQGNRCPPPSSLAHLVMQKEDHEAEEECLFFVALSRARDYLCLSRAERYTSMNASASKFLERLSRGIPVSRSDGTLQVPERVEALHPPEPRDCYGERELDVYMRCPRRYRYEVMESLRGGREASPYLRFHRCVHRTLGWLEAEATAGRPASPDNARAELARQWDVQGPRGGFEGYYRAAAESMVESLARLILGESGGYDREEWQVELGDKRISITPDRVILEADGAVRIQRVRTGRKTKSEPESRIYALIRKGAAVRYAGRQVVIETFYPATGEAVPVPPAKNEEKLLNEYAQAIVGIERGDFTPAPDVRQCPNCQCYFICGV